MTAMSSTSRANTIYIGVDFGTTFSGVAVVFGGAPNDIEVIKTWPGVTTTSDKCPTLLLYDENSGGVTSTASQTRRGFDSATPATTHPKRTEFGPLKNVKWGFEIWKPNEQPLRCIKLLLDRNQKLPAWVDELETSLALQRHDRLAKDAVADYLAKIGDHIKSHISTRYTANFLKGVHYQYVLTVPAVWSDVARDATLSAAKHAGLGPNITMVSEPEAAAHYSLKSSKTNVLRTGNHIVVCDAGGGTVDLISYRVCSTKPTLKECAVGTGDVCGAFNLNMRFEAHVKNRLGSHVIQKLKAQRPKSWKMATEYFENEPKRRIHTAMREDFEVPLYGVPDDETIGMQDGFLNLTSDQVRDIFEPVISSVLNLIGDQVSMIQGEGHDITAILLVGGFGQSKYLWERVQDRFGRQGSSTDATVKKRKLDQMTGQQKMAIEVMQPLNAWTAIAQGAALWGLDSKLVTSRRCRYNYGIAYEAQFVEGVHALEDRYWDPSNGTYRANDAMEWYVKKGDEVVDNRPVSFEFYQDFSGKETLYYNDADVAPPMKRMGQMRIVCQLHLDLSKVSRKMFTLNTDIEGEHYWRLDYLLNMRVSSATVYFYLIMKNVEFACVTAKFE